MVLTLSHSVLAEMRGRTLVALDVRGTPITELWHASTLGLDRALPDRAGAAALRDDARGDAGDVRRAGRDDVDPGAARGARHVVALRRGVASA